MRHEFLFILRALCHRSEAAHIGKQDRNRLTHTTQGVEVSLRVVEHFAHNVLGHVTLQSAPGAGFLPALQHKVVKKTPQIRSVENGQRSDGEDHVVPLIEQQLGQTGESHGKNNSGKQTPKRPLHQPGQQPGHERRQRR